MQVNFCRAAGARERASSREELTTRDAKNAAVGRPTLPYPPARRHPRVEWQQTNSDNLRRGEVGSSSLFSAPAFRRWHCSDERS